MPVKPEDITTALGRPTPATAAQVNQWNFWIDAAYRAIQRRAERLGVDYAGLNEQDRDYVVTVAVAAQVRRPDDATTVEVQIDDANTRRTYSSSTGRISIADDLWEMLGLEDPSESGSFSISPSYTPDLCGERGLAYPWSRW